VSIRGAPGLVPLSQSAAALCGLPRFDEFTDFIGLPEIQEPEQRFTTVPVDTSS
jgi:hypothetical protein